MWYQCLFCCISSLTSSHTCFLGLWGSTAVTNFQPSCLIDYQHINSCISSRSLPKPLQSIWLKALDSTLTIVHTQVTFSQSKPQLLHRGSLESSSNVHVEITLLLSREEPYSSRTKTDHSVWSVPQKYKHKKKDLSTEGYTGLLELHCWLLEKVLGFS